MFLILEDSTALKGQSFGADKETSGEVVFNTGMVGYPEALTDPSYRGQILVLTYPLIGNYGINKSKIKNPCHADMAWQKSKCKFKIKNCQKHKLWNNGTMEQWNSFESEYIQIAGLIVSEYCSQYSHPSAKQSLADWLKSENIPSIEGIDTRALTEKLREKGTMLGKITNYPPIRPARKASLAKAGGRAGKLQITNKFQNPNAKCQNFDDPNERNLAAEVSCEEPIIYEQEYEIRNTILLYDCGVKVNIIRSLLNRNCRVVRVPWDHELAIKNYELKIMNYKIDGIVISNGPGDPTKCDKTIEQIKKILEIKNWKLEIPILGICLGNQILALAAGAKTYKLKYGHRGQNQPVSISQPITYNSQHKKLQVTSYKLQAFITSQNHGFAVDEKTLPSDWNVWFKNLNDGTVEGIRHRKKPWMAVQFHPEAAPGPTDTEWIFDEWLSLLH